MATIDLKGERFREGYAAVRGARPFCIRAPGRPWVVSRNGKGEFFRECERRAHFAHHQAVRSYAVTRVRGSSAVFARIDGPAPPGEG